MFLGTYAPKLDEKGRIILPAKFRDELAGGVVMTRGQERCLYVFSHARVRDAARQDPPGSGHEQAGRDYLRVFLSGASAETPDKQHRVTIPANLRELRRARPRPHGHRRGQPRRDLGHRRPGTTYLAEQESRVRQHRRRR